MVITVCTLASLDIAHHGSHPGIIVGLAIVPAFGLLRPRWGGALLLPGALAFLTALLLGIGEWRSRPFVVLFTLVDITVLTYIVWRIGRVQAVRPRNDLAEVQNPGRQEDPPDQGSWQVLGLRVAYRCLPLPSVGHMRADFHDVRQSPFGVRLLVADLAGRSAETEAAAKDLRYRWRRLAGEEPSLADMARRLDTAFDGHSETFARALLLNIRAANHEVDIVSCGHQPPYVLAEGSVSPVRFMCDVPPIGLFTLAPPGTPIYVTRVLLEPGRRLLILTDGATEALDAQGDPFPLTDHAFALDGCEPGTFLAELAAQLSRHRGNAPRDEAMLIMVENDERPSPQNCDVSPRDGAAA